MPTISLSNLSTMVRKKRGEAKLRATAQQIGISPATLMRVENGRIPDIETFGRICNWLQVDPGSFLGFKPESAALKDSKATILPLFVSAHFKADQTPKLETVNSLAKMILLAVQSQYSTEALKDDEDA
jgi:transcriptional regulator with XRE-family HTH domain